VRCSGKPCPGKAIVVFLPPPSMVASGKRSLPTRWSPGGAIYGCSGIVRFRTMISSAGARGGLSVTLSARCLCEFLFQFSLPDLEGCRGSRHRH